jgi:hypothetical protein
MIQKQIEQNKVLLLKIKITIEKYINQKQKSFSE